MLTNTYIKPLFLKQRKKSRGSEVFLKNWLKVKQRNAFATLETAFALFIFFFFVLFLSYCVSYVYIQNQILQASTYIAKEVSLFSAFVYGYQKQSFLEKTKEEKMSFKLFSKEDASFEKFLQKNGFSIENFWKDFQWTLGASVLGLPERFLSVYHHPKEFSMFLKRPHSFRYLLHQESEQMLRLEIYWRMPFLFFEMEEKLFSYIPLWKGKDFSKENSQEEKKVEKNIWKEENFQRGHFFAEKEGAQLPRAFPVIQSFETGKAKMIKSIDLNKKSYRDEKILKEKLKIWSKKLKAFKGARWGKHQIEEKDILEKTLIIYCPEDSPQNLLAVLNAFAEEQKKEGMIVVIKFYEKSLE